MTYELHEDKQIFLSTLSPGPGQRLLALTVVLLSFAVFAVVVPFAKVPLAQVWAFIPTYQSALVICDLITAVLLFGQFHSRRARSLSALASGYLFTGLTAIVHMTTFPGLFEPTGLLGAGPQTTAWLYMIWHGGFPMFVIAYALLKRGERTDTSAAPNTGQAQVLFSFALVLAAVCGCALLVTQGQALLPELIEGTHYTPMMIKVTSCVWALSLAALVVLWRFRSESVLDLWLMVVMCAWLVDIALAAVLNGARFDLGFYAGRVYGLLAASFVLLVLLVESGMLYARLIEMMKTLRRLTSTDALTEITNRRAFDSMLEQEWSRAMRGKTPLSLLMIDVDCFKSFNDTYGHIAGDNCLRAVAQALAGTTRSAGDLVARYGGEEFIVLLPQTSPVDALLVAQRMRLAVLELGIAHKESLALPQVTVSIGIGNFVPACDEQEPESWIRHEVKSPGPVILIDAADKALYVAKASGRNQVSTGEQLVLGELAALHQAADRIGMCRAV